MSEPTEDDLARTATSADGLPAAPLGETLGRYRLEGMLGEGGMGSVHAAFDPDLERRVALKVLRVVDRDTAAQQRLLREARAMARVKHVNVAAVHEVGSVDGRDYIAMELIDGETLDHWLRVNRRSRSAIVDAFVAAGRGLAAAHAAGLVHRDFKPQNVLRQHDGRIVVTDFGLARGADGGGIAPDAAVDVTDVNTPTPLSAITATGSVLGTPAYMAPEQWGSGVLGPATDQFAFCVALWEALSGVRPYHATTADDLKATILRGPSMLDASKLPRRLRGILRRGLDPDPAKRWPNMNALLHAIARAYRRREAAIAVALVVPATAAALYFAFGRGGDACQGAAIDPATVWSPTHSAALVRADQAAAAEAIDRDFARWRLTRQRVCRADRPSRKAELGCLDDVLARLAVVARAAAAAHVPRVDAGEALIDPVVCERSRLPRFASSTAALVEAMTSWLEATATPRAIDVAASDRIASRAGADPCAAALAHALASTARGTTARQRHLDEADSNAQRCGDDRIDADIGIATARTALGNGFFDRETSTRVERAEGLVATIPQRDLEAELELLRMEVATRADQLDAAIAHADAAAAAFAERGRVRRQLAANLSGLRLRMLRATTDEVAAVPRHLAGWRALAVGRLASDDELVHRIDYALADWFFATGDVAAAHAMWDKLRRPDANDKPVRVTGRVVDASGAPIAGAIVVAAPRLRGDSLSVAIGDVDVAPLLREARTAADGTFELTDAASEGMLIAQHGAERSAAIAIGSNVTLQLEPTSRLSGTVDLRGEPATNVRVVAIDTERPVLVGYELFAPVQPDGSFVLDGVPRGRIVVRTQVDRATAAVIRGTELDVRDPDVRNVQLVVGASKRVVQVIVRSTVGMVVPNAQAVVLPGRVASTNAAEINRKLATAAARLARPPDRDAPSVVTRTVAPGDLYASVTDAPEGEVSACAVALPADLSDPEVQKKLVAHIEQIMFTCVPVVAGEPVTVIEVPPFPRLD